MSAQVSSSVPSLRRRTLHDAPLRPGGGYVLYWMTASRRTRWNFALDRALELATELGRPLVVLEALRCDYPWASDRLHRFVLQGMADNARALSARGVLYHPYVESEPGGGRGLLARLAQGACAVVTDDAPQFFLPRMLEAAAGQVHVHFEAVDSCGLLPLRATDRVFARAFDLRRFLQRELGPHLAQAPRPDPLLRVNLPLLQTLPIDVRRRWPRAEQALLEGDPASLAALPIDHEVGPVERVGGARAGRKALRAFVERRLEAYPERRNHPDADGASGLSPYLHFGHLSPHAALHAVGRREDWDCSRFGGEGRGARLGWWGMTEAAESFLDELVTWRELGLNFASKREDIDRYESLPEWARTTLEEHASDRREHIYDLEQLRNGETHDGLWNAAQAELRQSGCMHNYLRMLWGKSILGWSPDPRAALEAMIELNNRYALDGRDPNSYSGIFWVLGRYDRAWGPERPVFGKVRYMSSKNTHRKLKLNRYLERWGPSQNQAREASLELF